MVFAVPEQLAMAWGGFGSFGGCGFGFGDNRGFGCEVGFFRDGFHKLIILTISQINICRGNGDDQKAYSNDNQDQNQKDKQTVCLNTAVNTDEHGFVTVGAVRLSQLLVTNDQVKRLR